jgi:nucleoside-diphosphate-sugar epimerase
MKILVTGSAGHLGDALVRTLRERGDDVIGLDVLDSPATTTRGSIVDRAFVANAMRGVHAVLHAATLHKPHVATHPKSAFVDVNVTGTLNLLEAAVEEGVGAFVYTSTTSAFGRALSPPAGSPAAWITEDVRPAVKNVYGATKVAAEDLCELAHREHRLPCLVLRTSRFFPEPDDDAERRDAFDHANLYVNELVYRRADIEDVVTAHLRALERAQALGFGRYIVSATTPFQPEDLAELGVDAPAVLARRVPQYTEVYAPFGWKMLPTLDRVYVNERARRELGWTPRHDFAAVLERLARGEDPRSALALAVGAKGYHRPSRGGAEP